MSSSMFRPDALSNGKKKNKGEEEERKRREEEVKKFCEHRKDS